MTGKVKTLPGVAPAAEAKVPNDHVISALETMLEKAKAGDVQALCFVYSGFDHEPIHGRGLVGEVNAHLPNLFLQSSTVNCDLQSRAISLK